MSLKLANLDETAAFGRLVGRLASPGDIITLTGELGAGKTTLTQFIGQGLEVPESCYITSPTFSIMHEYPGRLPLYHFDLYRVGQEEIIDMGFEDYLYGEGVSVIEWPDRLGELLPEDRVEFYLSFMGNTAREIEFRPFGEGRHLLEALRLRL